MALQQPLCPLIGQVLVDLEFPLPCGGQLRPALAGILRIGGQLDHALLFQRPEKTAHQAGVEPEIGADGRHIRAAMPDGVEHTGSPQRAATAKKRRIQRPHLGSDGTAETAETGDIVQHNLPDLSQIKCFVKRIWLKTYPAWSPARRYLQRSTEPAPHGGT